MRSKAGLSFEGSAPWKGCFSVQLIHWLQDILTCRRIGGHGLNNLSKCLWSRCFGLSAGGLTESRLAAKLSSNSSALPHNLDKQRVRTSLLDRNGCGKAVLISRFGGRKGPASLARETKTTGNPGHQIPPKGLEQTMGDYVVPFCLLSFGLKEKSGWADCRS